MRIAFYAPMKPPDHPHPSGDRRIARLLLAALAAAGHEATVASRFRSYDGAGDPARQRRLQAVGARLGERLARRLAALPAHRRPALWLTYHLYHKAPDFLGPPVARALGIPYAIAEASHAPKQAAGRWAPFHDAAAAAIGESDLVLAMNSDDVACLAPLRGPARGVTRLRPFLGPEAPRGAPTAARRAAARARVAARFGLDPGPPWLLAVAMMRPGDKAASYLRLADALARLPAADWRLMLVGDGAARGAIEAAFAPLRRAGGGVRVAYAGEQAEADIPAFLAAADMYVWPAVNEAFGMALLEAQAAGLPVVAGRSRGVADIVVHGRTGLLTPPGDARAFADAVAGLLAAPARRAAMAAAAAENAAGRHGFAAAVRALDTALAKTARARAA